ncbi:MAG: 4-demethylwyosine synthase TYW1 [Thermoplasmata archaeon]|jgi:tRNA wybutosine-synthesizing protein 1|nr:4-demethylwyosine synthase TYW1 [Thermoplasmatales archaeon]PMP73201.1 MAG: 4-demethylwyosine synthase TYW1 [Aciduliprofundum sp.]
MEEAIKLVLRKQGYMLTGENSAVKLCHWFRESILHNRPCYKETFYGIRTHRCIQMTPALNQCTQNCLFCWRFQGFTETYLKVVDDPVQIVEGSIEAQRKLISGYGGNPDADQQKLREAYNPRHVAISLTGEPTLYPRLGELIEEYHRRGITTFLVTNGTMPEVLENLDPLPTQLYVTVAAPNEDIYKRLLVPLISRGWERLNKTLELLPSLDTRKVIRHTLLKGWNMEQIDEYARLDLKADPHFIEPKGYVYVGYSRERVTKESMPSHEDIRNFSRKLSDLTGYYFSDEREDSRVVLLEKYRNFPKISSV